MIVVNRLNANRISLSVKETEMVIFKFKQKKFEGDLKIKLCGKSLYPIESVKYLFVYLFVYLFIYLFVYSFIFLIIVMYI